MPLMFRISGCRNIAVWHELRGTLIVLFGSRSGLSLKREVHYEPHANDDLDRKQEDILKKLNISSDDCLRHPAVFKVHPHTIEHHGLLLQEGGFKKLSASLIVNYLKIVKKKVRLLKVHDYISPQTNVVDSFLHHLGSSPDNMVLNNLKGDENQFIEIYDQVIKSYLVWRLDTSFTEIDRIMKTYPRIRHRSFKYLRWSLDILESELGFSKQKILRHGYLIHSHPHNTLDTLERVPALCGKDIRSILHSRPKIVMTATETILDIVKYLKEYEIPDSAVHRCLDVFTLGSESMQRRLRKLHTVPEFRPYAANPRVLQIVHYQHKVSARLDQLQELQRQCASLHVLTSNQTYFDWFARDGLDRTRGVDVVGFLAQKLAAEEAVIRRYISRHPFWCSVSLFSMQKTLDLLREQDFKNEDVLNNIHLLLYPSEEVKKILTALPSSEFLPETQKLCRSSNSNEGNFNILTRRNELAMCLYLLEKDHHFTGNGIWNTK